MPLHQGFQKFRASPNIHTTADVFYGKTYSTLDVYICSHGVGEGGHSVAAITNREVRELHDISNRAALNELEHLMQLGVVKKTGQGRSVRYELI